MKKWVSIIVSIVLVFSNFAYVINAEDDQERGLSQIILIYGQFLDNYEEITEVHNELVSQEGDAELIEYYYGEEQVGYSITVNEVVIEFAEKQSPYNLYLNNYDNVELYYDYANYGVIDDNGVVFIDSDGSPIDLEYASGLFDNSVSVNGTIGGVSPQLQGSYNCIVAALSNLIWYWGYHGKPQLTSGRTFENVKAFVDMYFYTHSYTYANNNVIAVANYYGSGVNSHVAFNGGCYWTTSYNTMIAEIDAGFPCLVGFAAGNPTYTYSPSYGHMTMCYGYYYYYESGNTRVYMVLADGHSASPIHKVWTAYNNCTIQVRPV